MKPKISSPDIRAVEKKKEGVCLQIFVPADLEYFQGHFPSKPILPGVAQVHWAIEYSQKYLNTPGRIKKLEVIKFRNLIVPHMLLHLKLVLQSNGKLQFRYDDGDQQMSSGRVIFQERAIGQ